MPAQTDFSSAFRIRLITIAVIAAFNPAAQAFDGPSFPLSSLDGDNGFVIQGTADSGWLGRSVDHVGDINGDGLSDIIVGASLTDQAGGTDYGETYVIFGKQGIHDATFDLSTLATGDGSTGFVLRGAQPADESGVSVSDAGDINGDGVDDLLIGAFRAGPGGSLTGEVYAVFGSTTGFAPVFELGDLALGDGSTGFMVPGPANSDQIGMTVSAAGDFNADGIGDFVLGMRFAGGFNGETYLVFGRDTGFPAILDLTAIGYGDGSTGVLFRGAVPLDQSGNAVSNIGDINNDGVDDIAIGAYQASPLGRTQAGETYVMFGSSHSCATPYDLADLVTGSGLYGFVIQGMDPYERSGIDVTGVGDVNGDGIDDMLIGANGASPNGAANEGRSYIVFGRETAFGAALDLATLSGSTDGYVINGVHESDFSGTTVSAAGDVNNDGINDVLIGARMTALGDGDSAGGVYVVYGSEDGLSGTLELADIENGDGSDGFIIMGVANGDSASVISNAGDFNGDTVEDFIIGAYYANGGAGAAYMVFGERVGPSQDKKGMVAHYRFEYTNDDESKFEHHLRGPFTDYVPASYGTALTIDPAIDDRLISPHTNKLSIKKDISIAVLARVEKNEFSPIVTKFTDDPVDGDLVPSYALEYMTRGRIRFSWLGVNDTELNKCTTRADVIDPTYENHIVATRSAETGTVKIWVNGVRVKRCMATAGNLKQGLRPLLIGSTKRSNINRTGNTVMHINDLRLFKHVLTRPGVLENQYNF